MIFDQSVPEADRGRILQALDDIQTHGDLFHIRLSRFILSSKLQINLNVAKKVGGSGSVQLAEPRAARRAVATGDLEAFDAAEYVRLNIARETIDTGGQRGIEGTFVHEGKHALDFSFMLSTFSKGIRTKIFNPTAYQREYSAHLTAAFYLRRRGGEYTEEGVGLGLLQRENGIVTVHVEGIRNRLKNSYKLTPDTPGDTLDSCSNPRIKPPGSGWLDIF